MLCHEFANRMGYSITVESSEGFGSTFIVHIPK
jgi:signal transduction histidine kinase